MKKRIEEAIIALGKISALLLELRYFYQEFNYTSSNSTETEKMIARLFDRPSTEALQFNNEKKVEYYRVWTEKEMKNMPYLKELKYRKTRDGIHQFRYRRNGYNKSFNSKNLNKAKEKAYNFIKSLNKILKIEASNSRTSLDFIAKAWLDLKREHFNIQTYRSYKSVYNNHIKKIFGEKDIKDILPIDLQPFFNNLFKKSGKSCENAKIILNGVFKYAVANRLCDTNPMPGVIIEKHVRKKGKALTDEQIKDFINKMSSLNSKYGLASLIILYTGIRGCELNSLSFDWNNGTFSVKNAKLKKSQKLNPDNLIRTVPIFPPLYELRTRIENEDWKISPKNLSDRFVLHWPENTVKDLRHTFSTKARESGIENELVNIWIGHSAGKNLTANTYTHFSMKFQKLEAKKLKFI